MLFLFYINSVANVIPKDVLNSIFADDLTIWASDHNKETAQWRVQEAVKHIESWCHSKKMLFSDKSSVTSFSTASCDAKWVPSLNMNNLPMKFDQAPKLLGLYMNRTLSFQQHVEYVVRKIEKRCNLLACLGNTGWGWKKRPMRSVYLATQRSILDYAAPAWQPWIGKSAESSSLSHHRPDRLLSCGSPPHRSGPAQLWDNLSAVDSHLQWESVQTSPEPPKTPRSRRRTEAQALPRQLAWEQQEVRGLAPRRTNPPRAACWPYWVPVDRQPEEMDCELHTGWWQQNWQCQDRRHPSHPREWGPVGDLHRRISLWRYPLWRVCYGCDRRRPGESGHDRQDKNQREDHHIFLWRRERGHGQRNQVAGKEHHWRARQVTDLHRLPVSDRRSGQQKSWRCLLVPSAGCHGPPHQHPMRSNEIADKFANEATELEDDAQPTSLKTAKAVIKQTLKDKPPPPPPRQDSSCVRQPLYRQGREKRRSHVSETESGAQHATGCVSPPYGPKNRPKMPKMLSR